MIVFEKKVALVTGAGSGIGAAVAKELAAGGAIVVVADIDREAASRVSAQIKQACGLAHPFHVDVSNAASVEDMVQTVLDEFGTLNLAVNNAGIGGPSATVDQYPLDGWKKVIDVNLNGVFYCLKFEIAAMLKAGGGAIVNMASILGTVGWASSCAYVSAKHALVGLTRTAAMEFANQGIRVNVVAPAFIDTPLLINNLEEGMLSQLAALHPTGRIGTPEEVSALTCFLLSDRASFITGSVHLVDGGYTTG